jgi:hypothetical protein
MKFRAHRIVIPLLLSKKISCGILKIKMEAILRMRHEKVRG